MPKPSALNYIGNRQFEIDKAIRLRRIFRSELRRLRALPSPSLAPHWWIDTRLNVTYRAALADIRESARWLNKFALVVPLELITSEDNETDGSRTFTAILKKLHAGEVYKLAIFLEVRPLESESGAPVGTCRKVPIGTDTRTITTTTTRYQLVCD